MKKTNQTINAVLCVMVIMLLSTASVFAANGQSVTAHITASQSSATSNAIWNCQNKLELYGSNYSTSSNKLYVQCYEQRNYAVDLRQKQMLLDKGESRSIIWTLSNYDEGSNNYVKLNPYGALSKGCNGKGTLYD
ncbi:hypothetical protein [Xylanivirga thermophila]|uniref:hypothetical protein n=1 Tax=Xylanivirga thermophila TaxID=2496273 RepID=UPI00101DDA59|nr:hypothetical protein [Xylanivirga thermophila]